MSDNVEQRVSEQAYLHTSQAGAWVPLQQAGISGLLAGAFVMAICLKLNIQDGWFYALIGCMGVTIVMWTVLQFHWFNLTALEKFTGVDIDGDGAVGEPQEAAVKTVQVNVLEMTENGHVRVTVARFPLDEARLANLAKGLLQGTPFAERFWTGTDKPLDSRLSLDEFRAVRTEMLQRGLLAPVNPRATKQGYQLTRPGRAAMKELAAMGDNSPTPGESGA